MLILLIDVGEDDQTGAWQAKLYEDQLYAQYQEAVNLSSNNSSMLLALQEAAIQTDKMRETVMIDQIRAHQARLIKLFGPDAHIAVVVGQVHEATLVERCMPQIQTS